MSCWKSQNIVTTLRTNNLLTSRTGTALKASWRSPRTHFMSLTMKNKASQHWPPPAFSEPLTRNVVWHGLVSTFQVTVSSLNLNKHGTFLTLSQWFPNMPHQHHIDILSSCLEELILYHRTHRSPPWTSPNQMWLWGMALRHQQGGQEELSWNTRSHWELEKSICK